jgi:regulatory protein
MKMPYQKYLTTEQALQKLKHYCGYQERCHKEVIEKLYELGVKKKEHDEILSKLIEENYLNEERFAIAFASGKFRIKRWGKTKIKFELKQRQVSDYCIKKALAGVEDEEYLKAMQALAKKKYDSLKSLQYLIRKKRTMDYLLQKGYAYGEVVQVLKDL